MAHHERDDPTLFLDKCQELSRELASDVAVERRIVSNPKTVEDQEQQRVVRGSPSASARSSKCAISALAADVRAGAIGPVLPRTKRPNGPSFASAK
jgi:hypothetical protein